MADEPVDEEEAPMEDPAIEEGPVTVDETETQEEESPELMAAPYIPPYTPTDGATSIQVTKHWIGVPEGLPYPTAHLVLYDVDDPGTVVKEVYLSPTQPGDSTQTHIWHGVDTFKMVGGVRTPITYSVRETDLEGYSTTGPNITPRYANTNIRVTPNNSTHWPLQTPDYIITKVTQNGPWVIWTLDHTPEADRAAFIAMVLAAGGDLGPFGSLSINDPIIWLEGPQVDVDIFPDDSKAGQITIDIQYNPDGTVAYSEINYQGESTWAQFLLGSYTPANYEMTNEYAPRGYWTPTAAKVLTGRELIAGEFSFEIYEIIDGERVRVGTATNNADGTITFEQIVYTPEDIGTHEYVIVEVSGGLGGVEYSETEIFVTVVVGPTEGSPTLTVTATYEPDHKTFSNSYSATGSWTPEVTKVLTGRALRDGEFSFEVREGDEVISTGRNDATGKVTFQPSIEYTLDDVGTHSYTIREVNGNLGGVEYDI
ncbi:MAG TPA: hypothetical protein GXZ74_04045 [Tissierellia bacterium]|nr:hypothetical protein [Tissierellia bacterium]